jgi:hypothetical protein
MAAFWAIFTFGGSGPALTAHGSLDLKQEIQIQNQNFLYIFFVVCLMHLFIVMLWHARIFSSSFLRSFASCCRGKRSSGTPLTSYSYTPRASLEYGKSPAPRHCSRIKPII